VFPGHVALLSHGFEFLGYRFEAGQRWERKKSLTGLRDKIRALTKRNRGDSIESIIASINRPYVAGLAISSTPTATPSRPSTALFVAAYDRS